MYVVDSGNNRIQKFMMMTNSYRKLIDIFCWLYQSFIESGNI
jgi:hypothetical protein